MPAGSSKFGRTSFLSIAAIDQIDMIAADEKLDLRTANSLREKGVEVFLV
jgi:DeoR/GlpR family transcriptional regulator of sugar metabolism